MKPIIKYSDSNMNCSDLWDVFFDGNEQLRKATIETLKVYLSQAPDDAALGIDCGNAIIILQGADELGHLFSCIN